MRKILFILAAFLAAAQAFAQSSRQCFDFGWKFIEQDVPGAEDPSFDDGAWQPVDLPHDWDICHAPAQDGASGNDGGYYPGGIGWYRKSFECPQAAPGLSVKLHFEGVYQRSSVYLNGRLVGTHAYGYTPFRLDISEYLQEGTNTVAVRVDNSVQPGCRWYSGSGINRHTWLETYDPREIDDPTQLFVRTEAVYGISADGSRADSATVRISYAGRPDEIRSFRHVALWSPSTPVLYDIEVGRISVKHGFRTISYSAADGFSLNGQKVLINGACVHHDDGLAGAMAFDAAEIRKVRLMKEAGFNLIRTSHNPVTKAFLDACDSLGMMVIDEMYDNWYTLKTPGDHHSDLDSCYREDFRALVTSDRNHPSVICWSIGNEVIERKDIRVVHTARKFKNEILRYDSTRPVTEALCAWDSDWEIYDPHAEVLDIVGYNYLIQKHEEDHIRCPERVIWQTESYPRDAFRNWAYAHDYPYIIGDIVWTGLDYLGESGIGQFYYEGETRGEHFLAKHFPFHGAYCGDVDITGWRKPVSHYRDMLWNVPEGADYVYLSVREPDYYKQGRISETMWSVWPSWRSWNWAGWEGKPVEVEVFSKAPRVNLYLDDVLVGSAEVSRATEYKAVFSVPYKSGRLRAAAVFEGGREGASDTIETTGKPHSLRLTPESGTIRSGGQDLAYIIVEVVDKGGRVVPDAEIPFDVAVSGSGKLLSAGSASMKDLEPLTSSHVVTYGGRAAILVRSGTDGGTIRVSTRCALPRPSSSVTVKSEVYPNTLSM